MEKADNKSKDNNDDKTELPKLSTVVVDNYRLFKEGDKVVSVWGGTEAKQDELFDFGLNESTIEVHFLHPISASVAFDGVRRNSNTGRLLEHLIHNINKPIIKNGKSHKYICPTSWVENLGFPSPVTNKNCGLKLSK